MVVRGHPILHWLGALQHPWRTLDSLHLKRRWCSGILTPTPLTPISVNIPIYSQASNSLVLTVSGTNVIASTPDGGNNQLWMFHSNGTISSPSRLLLTIAPSNGLLFMAPATSNLAYQRWQRSDLYIVANMLANTNVVGLTPPLVIDVRQGNAVGVWTVNTPPSSNQKFTFGVSPNFLREMVAKH